MLIHFVINHKFQIDVISSEISSFIEIHLPHSGLNDLLRTKWLRTMAWHFNTCAILYILPLTNSTFGNLIRFDFCAECVRLIKLGILPVNSALVFGDWLGLSSALNSMFWIIAETLLCLRSLARVMPSCCHVNWSLSVFNWSDLIYKKKCQR